LKLDEREGKTDGDLTIYKGAKDTELVVEIRDAGHEFPQASIPKMIEFFKRNEKK
jgi:polyhydroxybutyrate depolymerase